MNGPKFFYGKVSYVSVVMSKTQKPIRNRSRRFSIFPPLYFWVVSIGRVFQTCLRAFFHICIVLLWVMNEWLPFFWSLSESSWASSSLAQIQSLWADNSEENRYPPRSHDCQPEKTEFAQDFGLAQEDLERREKNANHKRTMHMWENALKHVWNTRPIETTQKLIDSMPKVMKATIKEGEKQNIEFRMWFRNHFEQFWFLYI